jgi:hypothetical protein
MSNHPITPPPEWVEEWASMLEYHPDEKVFSEVARWGADQELDACCEWFQEFYKTESWVTHDLKHFRTARRPKPPTLKEQALHAADLLFNHSEIGECALAQATIRRALEALPND